MSEKGKNLIAKAREIREQIQELTDEEDEKILADAIIDVVEIMAQKTKTGFDDLVLRMLRRVLDVPDYPDGVPPETD